MAGVLASIAATVSFFLDAARRQRRGQPAAAAIKFGIGQCAPCHGSPRWCRDRCWRRAPDGSAASGAENWRHCGPGRCHKGWRAVVSRGPAAPVPARRRCARSARTRRRPGGDACADGLAGAAFSRRLFWRRFGAAAFAGALLHARAPVFSCLVFCAMPWRRHAKESRDFAARCPALRAPHGAARRPVFRKNPMSDHRPSRGAFARFMPGC